MNIHERMIERIDAVLAANEEKPMDRYSMEDRHVLSYIRAKLTPEALEARGESEGESVTHLMEVAKMRLRPYEEALTTSD